jgi:pimeloyl-ACP methyl ester carboxylesterase
MHLNSAEVDLQTHINDVVNLILFEDLHDIVLTGHSYGGMVITGVMDRVPDRIKHVVFLDAAVPEDGMSIWDLFGGQGPRDPERFKDGFMQVPWVKADAKPPFNVKQSIKCFNQPVSYKNPDAKKLPVTYVAFVPKDKSADERAKTDKSWQRAVSRGSAGKSARRGDAHRRIGERQEQVRSIRFGAGRPFPPSWLSWRRASRRSSWPPFSSNSSSGPFPCS